ncbi:MAG: hypothetical protein AAGA68_16910 [Pseudomonadota bacterium]
MNALKVLGWVSVVVLSAALPWQHKLTGVELIREYFQPVTGRVASLVGGTCSAASLALILANARLVGNRPNKVILYGVLGLLVSLFVCALLSSTLGKVLFPPEWVTVVLWMVWRLAFILAFACAGVSIAAVVALRQNRAATSSQAPRVKAPSAVAGKLGTLVLSEEYLIAFSYPGTAAENIEPIAAKLEEELGEGSVFAYTQMRIDPASLDFDETLAEIFRRARIIVPVLARGADTSRWLHHESREIRVRRSVERSDTIVVLRCDDVRVDWFRPEIDACIDLRVKSIDHAFEAILYRVLNTHRARTNSVTD